MGDKPGHDFRGNQYTSGGSNRPVTDRRSIPVYSARVEGRTGPIRVTIPDRPTPQEERDAAREAEREDRRRRDEESEQMAATEARAVTPDFDHLRRENAIPADPRALAMDRMHESAKVNERILSARAAGAIPPERRRSTPGAAKVAVEREVRRQATERPPKLKLVGTDGNAFSVLGLAQRAAKKAGWSPERTKAVMDEMRSGDYNKMLATAMKHFDVS
jgi:hypothetical protein